MHRNKHRTVGRFWSPDYRQPWASLQQQLAARFDKQPLIREVSVTSCMSFTAEPFFVPIEDTVLPLLRDGGFTDQAYKDCRRMRLVITRRGNNRGWCFRSTAPLRTAPGQGPGDPAFTEGVMRNCRQVVGRRCVFDNHDLDTDLARPLYRIYAHIKQLGPEIEFQTGPTTPKDFDGTITMGVSYGASSIELYQDYGGFPLVPDDKLRRRGRSKRRGRRAAARRVS